MNDEQICFTVGDTETAISIMCEAAEWLNDTGRAMWSLNELTREHITNPPEEFIVLWCGNESAAALLLSFNDNFFWPDVELNTSGFIHKLAVRRKFGGKGYAKKLIEHCAELCRSKNIYELRLDCDPHRPGLCKFYENCGFILQEIKTINTKRFGIIDVAMYVLKL